MDAEDVVTSYGTSDFNDNLLTYLDLVHCELNFIEHGSEWVEGPYFEDVTSVEAEDDTNRATATVSFNHMTGTSCCNLAMRQKGYATVTVKFLRQPPRLLQITGEPQEGLLGDMGWDYR